MSHVEVKIKALNTSRHRWYSRSCIIKAFFCQPTSFLSKLGLLFHILAKNIQLNHQSNLPDTLRSKSGEKILSGHVTVFLIYFQSRRHPTHLCLDLTLQMNTQLIS